LKYLFATDVNNNFRRGGRQHNGKEKKGCFQEAQSFEEETLV